MTNSPHNPRIIAFYQIYSILRKVCVSFTVRNLLMMIIEIQKIILILTFFTLPFVSMAQNNIDSKQSDIRSEVKKEITINKEDVVLRKIEPISFDPKVQIKNINFNKSNDIISLKAYIKSLQMKRKTTLMS